MAAEGARVAVFYDLETTGFGSAARVVQLGAVCGRRAFAQLVNPQVPIPPAASEVHGIDDAAVAEAPGFGEAWSAFVGFLGEVAGEPCPLLLLGYNNWGYDDKTLHAELRRVAIDPAAAFGERDVWSADVIRAMRADRRASGSPKATLRLGDVYERLVGRPMERAHDAQADCLATREVAIRLRSALEAGPFSEGHLPVDQRRKQALVGLRLSRVAASRRCSCRRVVSRFFACAFHGAAV